MRSLILLSAAALFSASDFAMHGKLLMNGSITLNETIKIAVNQMVNVTCKLGETSDCQWNNQVIISKYFISVREENTISESVSWLGHFAHSESGSISSLYHLTCRCTSSDGVREIVGTQSALVGEPPARVENFTCVTTDLHKLYCSWDPQTDRQVTWTAYFNTRNDPFCGYCVNNATMNGASSCRLDIYSLQHKTYIYIYGFNDFGTLSTDQGSFMLDSSDYFKSMKLPSMVAIANTTERVLSYTIQLPGCAQTERPNKLWNNVCEHTHNSETDGVYFQYWLNLTVDKNTPDYPHIPSSKRSINLERTLVAAQNLNQHHLDSDLILPSTGYSLRYSIRYVNNPGSVVSKWSDVQIFTFQSAAIAPDPVQTLKQGFSLFKTPDCESESRRQATIYWKSLSMHTGGNGQIRNYEIRHGNKSVFYVSNETSQRSMCISNNTEMFSVRAVNEVGRSERAYPVVIPPQQDVVELYVCDLAVIQEDQQLKVYVNRNLTHTDKTAELTVVFCNKTAGVCTEPGLYWSSSHNLSESEGYISIPVNTSRYNKMGVALQNQNLTSGIVWASCLYGDAEIGELEHDVNIHFEKDNSTISVYVTPLCHNGSTPIESISVWICKANLMSRTAECQPRENQLAKFNTNGTTCMQFVSTELDSDGLHYIWLTADYILPTSRLTLLRRRRSSLYGINIIDEPIVVGNRNGKVGTEIIASLCGVGGLLVVIVIIVLVKCTHRRFKKADLAVTEIPPVIIGLQLQGDHHEDLESSEDTVSTKPYYEIESEFHSPIMASTASPESYALLQQPGCDEPDETSIEPVSNNVKRLAGQEAAGQEAAGQEAAGQEAAGQEAADAIGPSHSTPYWNGQCRQRETSLVDLDNLKNKCTNNYSDEPSLQLYVQHNVALGKQPMADPDTYSIPSPSADECEYSVLDGIHASFSTRNGSPTEDFDLHDWLADV